VTAEEVSFEFRAKDSLGERIADRRWSGIPNGQDRRINDRWPKMRRVPVTTYFPAETDRREKRSLTELQDVTIEDK